MAKITVTTSRVEDVKKVYNRYAKKAQAVGLETSIQIGEPYGKKVNVYENDHINRVTVKKGFIIMEVVDIDITFPEYKLGNYNVIAVIEHGEDNKNIVYPCGDYTIPTKYHTAPGVCEHCNTKHRRVKTVLLQNNEGIYKQVGTGCLKEYTGVDDTLANAYIALDSIINEEDVTDGYYGEYTGRRYDETMYYLTQCVHLYNINGYNKNNKEKAYEVKEEEITETDKNIAKAVVDFFTAFETTDTFLNNIKNTITNDYCKPYNGFVAYAVVAYNKEMERIAKEKEREEELKNNEYYGNVGDKITVNVTGRCVGGYDTMYGYTRVYKFTDNNGHIFVWKTGTDIDTDDNGVYTGTVRGTIKAHDMYNNEKQTIMTRCKCVG